MGPSNMVAKSLGTMDPVALIDQTLCIELAFELERMSKHAIAKSRRVCSACLAPSQLFRIEMVDDLPTLSGFGLHWKHTAGAALFTVLNQMVSPH